MRILTETVTCNISESAWPAGAVTQCLAQSTASLHYKLSYSSSQLAKMCTSDACQSIVAVIKTQNPRECNTGANWLYADFLTPLDEICHRTSAPLAATATAIPSSAPTTSASLSPPTTATATPAVSKSLPTPSLNDDSIKSVTPSADQGRATSHPSSAPSHSSSGSSVNEMIHSSQPQADTITTEPPLPTSAPARSTAKPSAGSIAMIVIAFAVFVVGLAVSINKKRRTNTVTKSAVVSLASTSTGSAETRTGPDGSENNSLHRMLEPLRNWRVDSRDISDVSPLDGSFFLVNLNNARVVASKRMLHGQSDPRKLRSLIAEIMLVSTLNHPSIVEFVGVAWTQPSDLQALFEFMPLRDLCSVLAQRCPAPGSHWDQLKLKLALQIAEGLVYLHSFNPPIIHRNLQARKILLNENMQAKISDFSSSFHLETTSTMGDHSVEWIGPELASAKQVSERCDVYAFGILLIEMDTTQPLDTHSTKRSTLTQRLSALSDKRIHRIARRSLSENPTYRPSALELGFEFRQILKQ